MDEILWCDHSNESSLPVLSYGAKSLVEMCLWLHLAVKGLIELHVACKKWNEKATTTAQRIQMNLNTSCNKIALNFQIKKSTFGSFNKEKKCKPHLTKQHLNMINLWCEWGFSFQGCNLSSNQSSLMPCFCSWLTRKY